MHFRYIGEPINAVKIFNDFKADELIFLDIEASMKKKLISLEFVRDVGEEASMPFAVGGGIRSVKDIDLIIAAGAERVVIGSHAAEDPGFIKEASSAFGASTICVCIDVKKKPSGEIYTWINNGTVPTRYSPVDFARLMEENGAGEIILQSIEKDGMLNGYDIELIKSISRVVTIPVVALGGAGNLGHMEEVYREGNVNGLAAGSIFVYQGPHQGVLINYPDNTERVF